VEPNGPRGRPNRMFADTDAIRAFGTANSAQATDLGSVASALSSMPSADANETFGPVGSRFLSALADAATQAAKAVAALSDRLDAADRTAHASAVAYENADQQLGAAVSRL
jgi:hypothetical protein